MISGFQTVTDSGIVQIDHNRINFSLVKKGSLQVTHSKTLVTVTGAVSPVICVKPTGALVARTEFTYTGGVATWGFVTARGTTANMDYWVFDLAKSSMDIGPGISVYTPSGELAYNSNTPEMRVVGSIQLPAISSMGANIARQDAVPHNSAICLPQHKVGVNVGVVGSPVYYSFDGFRFNGNTLISDWFKSDIGFQVPGVVTRPMLFSGTSANVMIVDVSGL